MIARFRRPTAVLATLIAAGLVTSALAENVEKKFRVSFAIGGYNTQDEVKSNAANRLILTDEFDVPQNLIRDPRNDSAVFGDLTIQPGDRATIAVQYAVNKIFVVEGSVGYQKSDVGDIEVQAQFPGVQIPAEEDFRFAVFGVPAGELTQVPIQLSGMARFRPRANFNPYAGGGLGFIIVGFEPSGDLNALSLNMEASTGGFAPLVALGGIVSIVSPSFVTDLSGATVDARDSFAWHLLGGAELSFKKKWAVFLDLRYIFASRRMSIGFNGSESLGVAVPDKVDFQTAVPQTPFGPFQISTGGLVDGGQLKPLPGAPPTTDCTVPQFFALCEFVAEPDGQLDTGLYYVQGGEIKYGGISAQFGIRFTF